MMAFSFVLQGLISFGICLLTVQSSVNLSVGTYNLWNVMFNWKTRLQHTAKLILEHDLDVVVVQEVRLNRCSANEEIKSQNCPSQLDQLKQHIPEYRWLLAWPAGKVSKMKESINDEWDFEGLGVISRREILAAEHFRLRQTSFRDRNNRIVLHVKLKLGPKDSDVGDLIVVHFSYDPQQQCDNAKDIMNFIEDRRIKHSIVLGDFNVYEEMSPAVGHFVGSSGGPSCPGLDRTGENFHDVWLTGGMSHLNGLTFSNMPTPGLQSRPDRILVSKSIKVNSVNLTGNGSSYWSRFGLAATSERTWTVIKSGYLSFLNIQGYSCLHDCGPHGSCRCGVCVKGGDKNNCHLPDCSECSRANFIIFVSFSCIVSIAILIFFTSVVRILVITARFNQNDIMDLFGYRCCLFNRQLFQFKVLPRRFRIKFLRALQLFNLPPTLAALVGLLLLFASLSIMYFLFFDTIQVIASILPEEKFPSDHQLVIAKLSLP